MTANCAICGKPESEHHAFAPEMTDDDELIQRARVYFETTSPEYFGTIHMRALYDAAPILFRAVDERDDLRERVAELEDALADYPKWLGKLPHE